MYTAEADTDVTGTHRMPRSELFELVSLDQQLAETRDSILEELATIARAYEVETDVEERLVDRLQARLDRVSSLVHRSLAISQRRRQLLLNDPPVERLQSKK